MQENQSFLDLQVEPEISASMSEATRWGKFLAIGVIIAFVLGLSLMALMWSVFSAAIFDLDTTSNSTNAEYLVIVVIAVFVFLFLIIGILMSFLIKAANRLRNGLRNKDQYLFNSGLANLKNYFIMYGVLAILGLVFSLLGQLNNAN